MSERAWGGVLVPAVIAVIITAVTGAWLPLLIVVLAVAVGIAGYRYLPPAAAATLSTYDRPYRVAVYDRGLVIAGPPDLAPRVVRWEHITATQRVTVWNEPREDGVAITYEVPGIGPRQTQFGKYTNGGALVRSIARRQVVPVSWRPRTIGAAVTATVVALYVWGLVIPPPRPAVDALVPPGVQISSQLPEVTDAYSDVCDGSGTAFTAAPAYAGPGPHPIAVFQGDADMTSVFPSSGTEWLPDNPASVQLVACITQTNGRSTGQTCNYTGFTLSGGVTGKEITVLNTLFRITVYQARTRQKVETAEITGANTSVCPKTMNANAPGTLDSTFTNAQLQQVLDPYVDRAL
jgi:hypothetical protein